MRSKLAVRFLDRGMDGQEVAEAFDVSPGSVSRWKQTYEEEEIEGLEADPYPGLPVDWTVILDHWIVHHRAVRLFADWDEFHVVRSDEEANNDEEEEPDSTATTLAVEWLPAYAPDLNPVEGIWNQTKYGELGNFAPNNVETLKSHVERSVATKQNQTELLQDYIRTAGLRLL